VSVLWVLPLLFYAGGAVLLLSMAQRAAEAGTRLREECSRLDALRTELLQLRGDSDTARTALDRLHSRSASRAARR